MRLVLISPAKVNFTLEILGRRPDGFHELRTIFQTLELADTLLFNWNASEARLICDNPGVPQEEENLIFQALRKVEKFLGFSVPVEIRLRKRIPMGAGLGGGSSNAASLLLAVAERFPIPESSLLALASSLGSDVPFFLKGGTMLGKGRGETLEAVPPFPPFPLVIVKPAFSVSTAFAYRKVREYSSGNATENFLSLLRRGEYQKAMGHMKNDFEEILFPEYPELRELKRKLLTYGALAASLAGSGSAMFAVAEDENHAKKIAVAVESFGNTWITKFMESVAPNGWFIDCFFRWVRLAEKGRRDGMLEFFKPLSFRPKR